jgi:signal transduction histidine kinase
MADPWWLAPGALALALLVGALALLLERGCCKPPAALGWPALAVIAAVWVVEICGPAPPTARFVFLALPPTALRIYWSYDDLTPLYLLLVPAWLGQSAPARTGLLALLLSVLSLVPPVAAGMAPPDAPLAWWLGMLFSWLAAHMLARQRRLVLALRAAQADLAARAAAEERRRIAREVHDVIAHALTVTMLQITGARHVLRRDPARADAALAEAERLGRQSLNDIRRTVGLLDERRPSAVEAPLPTLDDLPELVEGFRSAGLAVDLRVDGEAGRLASAASLGLYRIAQEALANVARHAPGASVAVELVVERGLARLRVADSGAADGGAPLEGIAGSGLGIPGMRERAAMLGGSLRAGPVGDGWIVECTVPAG